MSPTGRPPHHTPFTQRPMGLMTLNAGGHTLGEPRSKKL